MAINLKTDVIHHKAALASEDIRHKLDHFLSRFEFEEGAVLIQVPQVPLGLIEKEVAKNRGYFAYPPQGLLYVSAILRTLEIKTCIVDLNYIVLKEFQHSSMSIEKIWKEALDKALAIFKNPFVCISFMFDATYPYFRGICEYIRFRNPSACIASGGVNATADAEQILADKLTDCVFSYEGEESLKCFYAYLRAETTDLPVNLNFLDSEGSIVRTPSVTGGYIDTDIRKEYSRIPIKNYRLAGSLSNYSRMKGNNVSFATIVTRRGCRGHCSFCGVRNFYGEGVRARNVEGIMQEFELLYCKYGIRHFEWLDDDLLFDKKTVLELFKQISLRFSDISWASNNGLLVTTLTPEIMQAMEESGCIGFKVGLESGNDSILKKVHKPISIDKFISFAEMSRGFPSMFVAANIIMGMPDETFIQMLDSFKLALRAKLDWYNYYMFQPIKNSEFLSACPDSNAHRVDFKYDTASVVPAFNPVRAGSFMNYKTKKNILSGYDIIEFDSALVPDKDQLKEIWFTFNHITNFLRLPALFTDSEIRLRNAISWMEALSGAYPDNAAINCTLYFLKKRLCLNSVASLKKERDLALLKLRKSEYWQFRDEQFKFSVFLDGMIPDVDGRYL